MSPIRTSLLVAGAALLALAAPLVPDQVQAAAPPAYTAQFLGIGTPLAMNDVGTVVGIRNDPTTLLGEAVVSIAGGPWQPLPRPAGFVGTAAAIDVNDAGVIVGNAFQSTVDTMRAVRWTPSASGYTVELLPLVAGETRSSAAAVNDAGQIVGARGGAFGLPAPTGGWLFTDTGGIVDLTARYGWTQAPVDLNDAGVALSATQTLDLATGAITDVGFADPSIAPVTGVAINGSGQIAGTSSTTIPPVTSVRRYTPGTGWQLVSGTNPSAAVGDINDDGTVAYSEFLDRVPSLAFDGVAPATLASLIDPAVIADGWQPRGEPVLDDSSRVAVEAINTTTFQRTTLLLTPVAPADTTAPAVAFTAPPPGRPCAARHGERVRCPMRAASRHCGSRPDRSPPARPWCSPTRSGRRPRPRPGRRLRSRPAPTS